MENLHYLYGDRERKPKVDMDWVESTSTATNPHKKWTIRTLCNGPARPTIPASLINSPSIYGGIWFRTNSQIAKSSKPILGAICYWAVCVCVWVCINFLTVSFIPIAIGWVCASENLVVGWNSATDSIKVFVVGLAKLVRFALLFRSVIPLGEVAYKRLKITKLYLFRCLHRIFLQNKSG